MNFKQLVLEALSSVSIKVLGEAEEGYGMKHPDSVMYNILINNIPTIVEYLEGGSYKTKIL